MDYTAEDEVIIKEKWDDLLSFGKNCPERPKGMRDSNCLPLPKWTLHEHYFFKGGFAVRVWL